MMSHTLKRKPKRSIGLAAAAIACILLVVVAANFLRREAATPVVQLAKLAENLHVAMFSSGVASGPSDPSDPSDDDKGDKGGVRVEVKVVVTAKSEPDGTPVRVDVQSALMTARLVGAFVDRRAEFVVPSDLLLDSGILVVRASTNDATGSALMQIRPDTAANGIVPLAGPRSVIADRKHWTMVSVIPQDVDGNGLADETPVRLHVRRPDGRTDIVEGAIRGLLDGIRVYGGTVAGLTTIRVEVQDATGPEVEVREVAGPPIPFRLEPPIGPLVADGRSLIAIRTPLLRDPYGNTVEDGTAVDVIGQSPEGPFQLTTTTIDGRAIIRLRSASEPGQISLVAEVAGTTSEQLAFTVGTDAMRYGLHVTRKLADVELRVGPVISSLGGFAPDGTDVLVEVNGVSAKSLQLRNGVAGTSLLIDRGDTIRVKILGRSAEAKAP